MVLMQKPYQYPTKRSVWRIITDNVHDDEEEEYGSCCEIIGRFKTDNISYKMRYVKKPTPIILVNLTEEYEGLSIDGMYGNEPEYAVKNSNNEYIGIPCYLPEGVHHEIVQRAVELATAVYNPQALGNIVGIGNASATNLGIVSR